MHDHTQSSRLNTVTLTFHSQLRCFMLYTQGLKNCLFFGKKLFSFSRRGGGGSLCQRYYARFPSTGAKIWRGILMEMSNNDTRTCKVDKQMGPRTAVTKVWSLIVDTNKWIGTFQWCDGHHRETKGHPKRQNTRTKRLRHYKHMGHGRIYA